MNQSIDAARTPVRAWLLVAVLFILYILSFLDRQVLAIMVDPVRRDLGIDDFQISLLIGFSFSLFYAGFGIPLGWLVDHAPRRQIVFAGVTLWGLAAAACGLARNFAQLFFARMMVGAGEATLAPATYSMLSDAFPPRRRALALSIATTGAVVGGGLSLILGGMLFQFASAHGEYPVPLLGTLKPWQFVFIATGLPGVVLAPLIFLVREPKRTGFLKAGASASTASWGDAFRFVVGHRRLWLSFIFTFGTMNVVNGGMIVWQPPYLGRYFHWTPLDFGLALGLIALIAGAGGHVLSGWIVDRMFARGASDAHLRYPFWAWIVAAPIAVLGFLSTNVWLYLCLVALATLVTSTFMGYASAALTLTTPNDLRGRLSALLVLVVNAFGLGLGPTLVATLSQFVLHEEARLGYALALAVAVCSPIVLAAAHWGRAPFRRAIAEAAAWA